MNKFFAVVLFLLSSQVSHADVVDRVIATVDNEPILESDLTALKERSKKPFLLFDLLIDGDIETFSKANRKTQIDYLVNEKIVSGEISRLGLNVTLEKADQEIKSIAKRNNVSVDEIYASFKKEGLTVSQYQDLMKNKMERDSFLSQEIISKIRISDDDVLAEYLRQHSDAKLAVNEFTVAHIFFDPKKPGGPEAALTRARDGYQKIKNGESFDKLAEKISEDPNFSSGGLLGTFKAGEFLPEIEARVATLKPGEVSDVVKSRIGFHLVKLIGKKLATDPKFEKEKELIKRKLEMVSIQRQFKNWIEKKKDDISIKINKKNKTIFITTGDIDGIGLEITRKALENISPLRNERFIVFRSKSKSADAEMFHINAKKVKRLEDIDRIENSWGQVFDLPQNTSPLIWFETAVKMCLENPENFGVTTGPLSKSLVKRYGQKPIGHTEVIAQLSQKKIYPVFLGKKFHVILASSHLPLKSVPQALSVKKIEQSIQNALMFRRLLGRKGDLPIALVGLNPHAGEKGLLGTEEIQWKKLLKRYGLSVEGPLVPDVAYRPENWKKYSVFISPYHDQGLIPFKMAHGFHSGTQISFGAPFIRTSVDHGTAKDLYGKNLADPGSMLDSLQWCRRLIGK